MSIQKPARVSRCKYDVLIIGFCLFECLFWLLSGLFRKSSYFGHIHSIKMIIRALLFCNGIDEKLLSYQWNYLSDCLFIISWVFNSDYREFATFIKELNWEIKIIISNNFYKMRCLFNLDTCLFIVTIHICFVFLIGVSCLFHGTNNIGRLIFMTTFPWHLIAFNSFPRVHSATFRPHRKTCGRTNKYARGRTAVFLSSWPYELMSNNDGISVFLVIYF